MGDQHDDIEARRQQGLEVASREQQQDRALGRRVGPGSGKAAPEAVAQEEVAPGDWRGDHGCPVMIQLPGGTAARPATGLLYVS
jgi:hypothetical protein